MLRLFFIIFASIITSVPYETFAKSFFDGFFKLDISIGGGGGSGGGGGDGSEIVKSPMKAGSLPGDDAQVSEVIANFIAYGITLTGIFALIAAVWGGILMIVSSGDEEGIKKGKSILIYAMVGVLISALAYSAVWVVSNINF